MGLDIKKQIYAFEGQIKNILENIEKSSRISANNKAKIKSYVRHCQAKGLSDARILIILQRLKKIGLLIDTDFDKATKDDIEGLMVKLNQQGYTAWSLETAKTVIKAFWRWLYDLGPRDPLPPCVRWIQSKRPPNTLERESLLTEDEVVQLIDAAPELMWKALISVLYESAMRPGELLSLQIKDVHVNERYIKLSAGGKMEHAYGKRDVFLLNSYDLLSKWLDSHPQKKNSASPLWLMCNSKRPITTSNFGHRLSKIAERTTIKKRVFPYLFRHSRGTQMYIKYGEAIAKKYMGHSKDTKMARVYNHLNDKDVLAALLGEEETQQSEDKKCIRCKHTNSLGSERCSKCGLAFGIEYVEQGLNEESVKKMIKDVLKSLGVEAKKIERVT